MRSPSTEALQKNGMVYAISDAANKELCTPSTFSVF